MIIIKFIYPSYFSFPDEKNRPQHQERKLQEERKNFLFSSISSPPAAENSFALNRSLFRPFLCLYFSQQPRAKSRCRHQPKRAAHSR